MQAAKAIASICLAMSLSACASTQLNFNTLDVAGSIESLYTRQVLNNLSTFASAPNGLPSQIDIQSGTVQTSNAITPNISFPLTGSSTRGFSSTVAALTGSGSRTFAGAGAGMTASDGWQQNWNITPLTDANTLRNLRALYRYAVYASDIRREYHVPRTKQGSNYSADPFMLLEPQCVLCGKEQRVNSGLAGGWLYWLNDNGIEFSRMPVDADKGDLVDLGHYGSNQLFMKRSDYQRGVLSNFVLFVLPITEPSGSDPSKPGIAPGSRVGASANRPNFAPVPLGIQPPGP